MTDGPLLHALRAASHDPTPDAVLLRRYAATGDADAFELLVRRHGDLVWRVCRGILRNDAHAAEDAFQATFLALARKAGSVSRGDLLPAWLFRVARHAALAARRSRKPIVPLPDALPDARVADEPPDLAPILTEEIDKLAAKFRAPVLLCFYEGYTHAEAAERLGWAVGTVASRLARAKDQLRARLIRRGLAPAAVALALAGPSATGIPPTLIRSAAAIGSAAAASPPVLSLAEGVMSAMRIAKLKLAAAAVCTVVGLAGTGVMVAVSQEKKPDTGVRKPAEKALAEVGTEIKEPFTTAFPEIKASNEPGVECPRFSGKVQPEKETVNVLRRVAQERLASLLTSVRLHETLFRGGQWDANLYTTLLQSYRDVLPAAADVYGQTDELIRWYEEWVSVTKGMENMMKQRIEAGAARRLDGEQVRAERLHAEVELGKVIVRVKQKGLDR